MSITVMMIHMTYIIISRHFLKIHVIDLQRRTIFVRIGLDLERIEGTFSFIRFSKNQFLFFIIIPKITFDLFSKRTVYAYDLRKCIVEKKTLFMFCTFLTNFVYCFLLKYRKKHFFSYFIHILSILTLVMNVYK